MKKCADVIVTYNRKELLKENITALLAQTYDNHEILIIDNYSTDGTREFVSSIDDCKIKYYNTGANLGGAGGFSYGLKIAMENKYDYAWIMDDDSVPDTTALEDLVKKANSLENEFSFLASLVYWTDNKVFPMNFPRCDNKRIQETAADKLYRYKLIPVTGGSFVGCFVNLEVGRKVGLPISEFFIYGDDVEYTHRLKKQKPAYLDLESTILHKAPSNKGADIATAPADRIPRFYYQSRNGMYTARQDGTVGFRMLEIGRRTINIIKKAPNHKLRRLWTLYKGSFEGLFFNPKIKYPDK